jgi:hypothetical protein
MAENVLNGLNTGHLTDAKRAALRALASGATKDQAATVANRTRRTIDRWLQDDPVFVDALTASTDESVADAGRRLAALLDEAINVLIDIMHRVDVPYHVQLRAVDVAINSLIRLREHGALSDRVAALEEGLR